MVPLRTTEFRGKVIKRKVAQNDRRSYALYLTSKGAALLATLIQIDAERENSMRNLIGEKDAQQLLRLLEKLRKVLANGTAL